MRLGGIQGFGLPSFDDPQIAPIAGVGAFGKVALGVGAGGLGFLAGSLFGGGKKEQSVAQAQEMATIIHPYGVYTPTYAPTVSQQFDYSVMIESPGGVIQTKKEATQTPTFTITPTVSPQQQQEATQQMGADWLLPLAVVGVAGVIGYALLTKKKGGKK